MGGAVVPAFGIAIACNTATGWSAFLVIVVNTLLGRARRARAAPQTVYVNRGLASERVLGMLSPMSR